MTNTGNMDASVTPSACDRKRVVFTMGGKGGVGKTAASLALVEWFESRGLPCTLLDLDSENKAVGSLQHYFTAAHKVNINTPAGLDAVLDRIGDQEAAIILADMGAGSGQVAHDWFDQMHEDAERLGLLFTAVGIVTPDPASVTSVLGWAARLEDRVSYLIIENHLSPTADFAYWQDSEAAQRFRQEFNPTVLTMEFRLAELEHAARQHGLTLGQVAGRDCQISELQRTSLVIRAQAYRRRLFAEFDKAEELLVP